MHQVDSNEFYKSDVKYVESKNMIKLKAQQRAHMHAVMIEFHH